MRVFNGGIVASTRMAGRRTQIVDIAITPFMNEEYCNHKQ